MLTLEFLSGFTRVWCVLTSCIVMPHTPSRAPGGASGDLVKSFYRYAHMSFVSLLAFWAPSRISKERDLQHIREFTRAGHECVSRAAMPAHYVGCHAVRVLALLRGEEPHT